MKRLLLATTLLASGAHAGDKLIIGPAPAWVSAKPFVDQPHTPSEAPVSVAVSDQQLKVEAGAQILYSAGAIRIQTPQGLAAGNLSLPWNPETDDLSVHKLLIHRGPETIDVLASGQSFTVMRREANLESAMLDGMLTANIQPEGLQVGDVLELAFSITSRDPVLKGHTEHVAAAWNGLPVQRAHFKAQWPSQLPMAFRQSGALPPMKVVKSGATSTVELTLDNIEPTVLPKFAPARYLAGRVIELSDFRSWADLGALMAPLYAEAAIVPADGPLRAELEKIKAASGDPVTRTQAALALVQDRIRYVGLLMGTGGLVPAKASETWSRRFGDCKGKTALLLALLKELEVAAEPVAVNLGGGDGYDQRLPMIGLFNHVLVRATIAGKSYWLDGTRTGDTSLARLRTPDLGWGLPLVEGGAKLVRMQAAALDLPADETTIEIDARAGLTIPAPFKVETTMRGDAAVEIKLQMGGMTPDVRDRTLRDYWKNRFDFVEIKSVGSTFDAATGEHHLTMQGTAKMDWSDDWYEADEMGLGYKADFSRPAGPDRDAPFAVAHPFYSRTVETILLPPGFAESKELPKARIEEAVAGVEYRRTASLVDSVFRVEASSRSILPEFPAAEAPAAEKKLREMSENSIFLRKPPTYRMTKAELTAPLPEASAAKVNALMARGAQLLDQNDFDRGIAAFDEILTIEPRNALALANRGMAKVWKEQYDAATTDLDAAAAIDPENVVVFRARGLAAENRGDNEAAIEAYGAAIAREASDSFSPGHRAIVQERAGNETAALADSERALKLNPSWGQLHLMRANIFRHRGQREDALLEGDALAKRDDDWSLVAAGRIYGALNKRKEALEALDRALAISPEAYIFVNRAEIRAGDDFAAREADYDSALKLEPDNAAALNGKAYLMFKKGNTPGAVALYSRALANAPKDVDLLTGRGMAYAKAGDMAKARQDFAAASAQVDEAATLNNLCWRKAVNGLALEIALEECDRALAKTTDRPPSITDSRAFVLLRLGRLDEAIATYSEALTKNPKSAASLYGRAIAWSRKGDGSKAKTDQLAATAIDATIEETFASYGVTLSVSN